MLGGVHDGGEVVGAALLAHFEEAVKEGLGVAGVALPLEQVVDCHLAGEVLRLDESQVRLQGPFVLGRLRAVLVLGVHLNLETIYNAHPPPNIITHYVTTPTISHSNIQYPRVLLTLLKLSFIRPLPTYHELLQVAHQRLVLLQPVYQQRVQGNRDLVLLLL